MGYPLTEFTLQDDSLRHQVRFILTNNSHTVQISCNCRKYHTSQGVLAYKPIAPTSSIEESRRLYNDPVNHWIPFTDEDKAKW